MTVWDSNFILGWDKQAETGKSQTAIERDNLVLWVRTDNLIYISWANGTVCSTIWYRNQMRPIQKAIIVASGALLDFGAATVCSKLFLYSQVKMGNENLFKCSRSHDHVHINYGEKLQKYFSSEPRDRWLWTWYTASGTRVLTVLHMMTLGWPWLVLWQGQICFRILLPGWKFIQHRVLMYFQVCSNSIYPQHSGERYRTSGPLVYTCK